MRMKTSELKTKLCYERRRARAATVSQALSISTLLLRQCRSLSCDQRVGNPSRLSKTRTAPRSLLLSSSRYHFTVAPSPMSQMEQISKNSRIFTRPYSRSWLGRHYGHHNGFRWKLHNNARTRGQCDQDQSIYYRHDKKGEGEVARNHPMTGHGFSQLSFVWSASK